MLSFACHDHEKTEVMGDIVAERFWWQQAEMKRNKIHSLHMLKFFFFMLCNRRPRGTFSVGTQRAYGQTHTLSLTHVNKLYLWWSVKEEVVIDPSCMALRNESCIELKLPWETLTFLLISNKHSVLKSRLTHKQGLRKLRPFWTPSHYVLDQHVLVWHHRCCTVCGSCHHDLQPGCNGPCVQTYIISPFPSSIGQTSFILYSTTSSSIRTFSAWFGQIYCTERSARGFTLLFTETSLSDTTEGG